MLLVLWYPQLLVQNVVFHLHFGLNCRTLQRGLCATTHLLVSFVIEGSSLTSDTKMDPP